MKLAIGLALLAVILFLIGRWGQRNLSNLVSNSLSEHGRAKQARSLRRGAVAFQILAGLCLVIAVLSANGTVPIGR